MEENWRKREKEEKVTGEMKMDNKSRDRIIVIIVLSLLAVAILSLLLSLRVVGEPLERQVMRRRWGLTESQMSEIEKIINEYQAGNISLIELRRRIWTEFRNWGVIPPQEPLIPDIELFYTVKSVFSTLNIALVIILLAIFIDVYRKTKAKFALGLMIFSLILLLYTVSSNPFMQMLFGFRAIGLGPFAMLPDIFAFIALLTLLYISLK